MTITSVTLASLPSQVAPASGNSDAAIVNPGVNGTSDQPAVIVTLSTNAAAQSSASVPPLLNPNKVAKALSDVSGANGFAFNYAHGNWDEVARKFGAAQAAADKANALWAVVQSAGDASQSLSGLGLPVETLADPAKEATTKSSQIFSVGAFSFTNDGSTYTVTPGANGAFNGTKDGQYWQSWQVSAPTQTNTADSEASAALKTLTTLSEQLHQTNNPSTKLDLSA